MRTNILQARKALLALFAMLMPLLASAQTKVEIDGIWYNLVSKAKQAEVTFKGESYDSYNEYNGSVTIPATVTHDGVEYSVTSIGNGAFRSCSSITSINIPEEVTNIGDNAFEGCSSLTSINIPEGVTSIKSWTFGHCSKLSRIDIPKGVTSIEWGAFAYCNSLTSITIPESVTNFEYRIFLDCSSLTSINLPSSITSIGTGTFSSCTNLTSIVIPEGVTCIEYEAFSGCTNLTSINLPNGVTSIGSSAFSGCSSLTSITIPEGVTNIEKYTFSGCSSLISIAIPQSVKSIEKSAFYGCRGLTSIIIPEESKLTSIGMYAFQNCSSLPAITLSEGVVEISPCAFAGCSNLTAIVLPKSVSKISIEAFANCPELTDVYCYAESVPSTTTDAFDGSFPEYATLHVPAGAINSYKATAPWSSFGKIIALGASITEITLSESSATLTEGEDLTLTMTTNPENADRNLISWSSSNPSVATVDNTGKVTAIAPGTAIITATANDGSGVSAQCEVTVNELILGKCATPNISYVNGEVVFDSNTEGAVIKSEINENASGKFEDMKISLIPTYTITAYATKAKYENSDAVTLTICWIPCDENHGETDDILTIPSKPVLISARDGVLTLSGLAEGTAVALYTTDGAKVAHQQSSAGEAKFTVDTGQVYLVHIDDKVVKIGM